MDPDMQGTNALDGSSQHLSIVIGLVCLILGVMTSVVGLFLGVICTFTALLLGVTSLFLHIPNLFPSTAGGLSNGFLDVASGLFSSAFALFSSALALFSCALALFSCVFSLFCGVLLPAHTEFDSTGQSEGLSAGEIVVDQTLPPDAVALRGQVFPFLRLPRELRHQIYACTVVSKCGLRFIRGLSVSDGVALWPKNIGGQRQGLSLNLAVLHLNRQVRREALLVFFAQNLVSFDLPGPLRTYKERAQRQRSSIWGSQGIGKPKQKRKFVPSAPRIFANPFRFQRICVYLDLEAYRIREHNDDLSNYWAVMLNDFTDRLLAKQRMVDELIIRVWNAGYIEGSRQLSGYEKMFESLLRLGAVPSVRFEINAWTGLQGTQLITALREEGEKVREVLEDAWRKRIG